jgi:site-specific DNA-methyltransferase (adenine-specific)
MSTPPTPYWTSPDGRHVIYCAPCEDVLPHLSGVHAVVTDPPAGISFMGKTWDTDHGGRDNWIAAFGRIASLVKSAMLPGAHALVWSIPRTSHWTATAWEDGGFEVRDRIAHCFGSGFPKSLDVGKAIDKAAGAERTETVGRRWAENRKPGIKEAGRFGEYGPDDGLLTAPATEAARQWSGWGTALKPAIEDWWLLRVPLIGTVAENVLAHGTGGLNIDGCRVGIDPVADASQLRTMNRSQKDDANGWGMNQNGGDTPTVVSAQGRWPAHLIHDGSEDVVGLFPETDGRIGMKGNTGHGNTIFGSFKHQEDRDPGCADFGSAARFFYCAKASKQDRDEGLDGMKEVGRFEDGMGGGCSIPLKGSPPPTGKNHHPTVKPTALMAYLCRLVTPPGGIILDPFMGSGSTGKAAIREGFRFIGIERDPDYAKIAVARMERELAQPCLPTMEPEKVKQEVLL